MKNIFALQFILLFSFAKADYWTQKASFPGVGRELPFSFSINNKGYIGSGKDGSLNYLNDFWDYDPSTNVWNQKANFGGSPRWGAIGFSINNKGSFESNL